MKRFLAIAACLSLAACGSHTLNSNATSPPGSSASSTSDALVKAEQARGVAEVAYSTINALVTAGVQQGLIKGKAATDIRKINGDVTAALQLADTASDAASIQAAVDQANAAITQLRNKAAANGVTVPTAN